MSIGALTSAFATVPTPAAGTTSSGQERTESTSQSSNTASSVPRVVFNPRSHFDSSAGVFVMEFRSADTGKVERQFPDEAQLRAYANAKKLKAEESRTTVTTDAANTDGVPQASTTTTASTAAAPSVAPGPAQATATKASAPIRLDV